MIREERRSNLKLLEDSLYSNELRIRSLEREAENTSAHSETFDALLQEILELKELRRGLTEKIALARFRCAEAEDVFANKFE